jgi:hypothetical protein
MMAVRFFESSGINYQTTRRNSSEDPVPQHTLNRNFPGHYFRVVKSILISDYFIFFIYCVLLMRD